MRRLHTEGRNRLLKVRVDYQKKNQWCMKPEYDKSGNRVSMGQYIFRGDDESFRKHLVRCKVSDVDSDPPSYRSVRYMDIVQQMKQPKRTYVWMQSKNWKAMNQIRQESRGISTGSIDDYLSGRESYRLSRTSTKGSNLSGVVKVIIGGRLHSIHIYRLDQNYYSAYVTYKDTNTQYRARGNNPKSAFMSLLQVLKKEGIE